MLRTDQLVSEEQAGARSMPFFRTCQLRLNRLPSPYWPARGHVEDPDLHVRKRGLPGRVIRGTDDGEQSKEVRGLSERGLRNGCSRRWDLVG